MPSRDRARWRRAVVITALVGILFGAVASAAAWDVFVHTCCLWKHGLRAEDGTGDGHPFTNTTDGACRQSAVAFINMRNGYHSPDHDGLFCHNHSQINYLYWNDTKAIMGSWQTGMTRHSHTGSG